MVKKLVALALAAIALHCSSLAQDRGFGLGVILGEPTGLSGKYWVSSKNAIDGGLAWSFRRSGFFHVHADYLWHFPLKVETDQRFTFYAGVGGTWDRLARCTRRCSHRGRLRFLAQEHTT